MKVYVVVRWSTVGAIIFSFILNWVMAILYLLKGFLQLSKVEEVTPIELLLIFGRLAIVPLPIRLLSI